MWSKKFRLLCWKNWILVKRHWIQAIFEILFPIVVVIIFSYARDQIPRNAIEAINYPSFELPTRCFSTSSFSWMSKKEPVKQIGFAPKNDFHSKLMQIVGKKFGFETYGLKDEDDLNFWIRNQSEIVVAAIQFESPSTSKHLKYAIRLPEDAINDEWRIDQMFYISPSKTARRLNVNGAPFDPPYVTECFLSFQNEIDRTFINLLKDKASLPSLTLQAYPYPSVVDDMFLSVALTMFPFLFVVCMTMAVKSIIKNITLEIETSLKESMKMMGLSAAIFWSSWYLKSFIMMIIPFTINVLLLTTTLMTQTPMFAHSNALLIWIFFAIYITSVITFCFLMSVLFKKSTTAGTIGTLLFFLAIFPYNSFKDHFHSFPYILKAAFCMLVNTNMGQAMNMILGMESNDLGIQFSNLFHRDINTRFSFGELLIFMIIGCVIQVMLTCYVEAVFPGEFGISQPFYYPLLPCLSFLKKRMGYATLANEAILQERKISNSDIEDEPENLNVGIRITNMSKKFGDKFAVNKLSLNMFNDQITVLLGHNGAGKTTTFSMLVGLFSPSSGTAYLNGKDIRTELDEARASVGICFQHNILFEELTVKEHLTFFCALKGIEDKRLIAEDVRKYISLLDLKDKMNSESRTLSGGMKRKLCIGIALCGNAKIVILDEPTSGIDVAARRHLWDLLIAEKKDRSILLSTHFMDEADVLGDRIAIMTEGRLRTVGSSFFLKKKFGTGYRLTCVKNESFVGENVQKVLERYVPDVFVDAESSTEVVYVIGEDKLPMFQHIFRDLEDNSMKLGIDSFGCSLSTLEEVFLKLGVESYHDGDEADGRTRSQSQVELNIEQGENNRKVDGVNLTLRQIEAVFLKKFHVFRRSWKQLTYLASFNIFMLFIIMSTPQISFNNEKVLNISFETYEDTETIFKPSNANKQLTKSYESLFGGKDKITVLDVNEDISDYILKKANESFAMVNGEYLVGAQINRDSITAWFNGQPYHTLPLTINTINRALLKSIVGNDYDISVSNKPYILPTPDSDGHRVNYEDPINVVMVLLMFYFLLTSWSIIFIASYIKERELRAKLLQYISGLNRYIYWITSFVFDYVIFSIISVLVICGIGAFQRPYFSTAEELSKLLVIALNYGFAIIPFSYAFSYLFAKHSTGESILTLVAYGLSLLYGIIRFLLFIWEDQYYRHFVNIVYWIGLFFAPFSFVDQLSKLGMSVLTADTIFTFKESGIGSNIILCLVSGCFFLAFCILKDHLIFERFFYKFNRNRALPPRNATMDRDVKEEIDKVKSMTPTQIKGSKLVMQGLTKYYGNFLAVNQLYLDVEQRDCFGLLGVNGSGKTSTFKMMTGDELISSGDGWVNGHSMKNELSKVHEHIGYTPQFDAIIPELTGYETLKIFSLIRGLPRLGMNSAINHMANEFGFAQHLNKQIKAFSGGNKRKLSTALALLGNPQLIFLDEPTTGIDPQAKHHMWTIIKKIRDSGRAVVITSHSMDECEALCTKIGIMVSGEFKCLGSVQHLKNKYSKGFVLTVKMGRDDEQLMMNIQNQVIDAFQLAELKEKYLDILTFHITNTQIKWSEMFRICASLKEALDIQDYALTQMSLEQVFMIFSKSGIYQNQQNATD